MDELILAQSLISLACGLLLGVMVMGVLYVVEIRPRLIARDAAEPDPRSIVSQLAAQSVAVQSLHQAFMAASTQLEVERDTLAMASAVERPASIARIAELLREEAKVMTALGETDYGDTLSMQARQRILQQQLVRNEATLQQLKTLLDAPSTIDLPDETAPDNTDINTQYNEILMQLDELAKLVQQQSTKQHPATTPAPPAADDSFIDFDILSEIKGIGPVYSNRLHEAGIFRFEQLARRSPTDILTILELPSWRQDDVQDWIAEAQARAGHAEAVEGQG